MEAAVQASSTLSTLTPKSILMTGVHGIVNEHSRKTWFRGV